MTATPVPTAPAPAPALTGPASLVPLFRPRSVAVIGASRTPGSIGGVIFDNLIQHAFEGVVYPVNPKADHVRSVRAYPSVDALPEVPDLAVVVVPGAHVEATLDQCGRRGVKAAIVISAGFKEVGGDGVERERRILEVVRRHGMRMVGPNCLGVLNRHPQVRLDATFASAWPPAGPVAFSSQSGALGLAILEYARTLGIGISHFVSVGNKADVSGNDLLEYWEQDDATRVVLLYLESFGNPRRFLDIARRVGRTKPIVAVKSGRTRAGMRAASSHTGSLAGADTAVDALCSQAGVIRVNTIEELFDVGMLFAHQPPPRGNRVAIVTNAGGPGIMASDACESHGLEVVTLTDETIAALRAFLPPEASTKNPVDMIASAAPVSFEKATRLALLDPNVDAVLVIFVPPVVTNAEDVSTAIVRGATAAQAELASRGVAPKTVLSCFMGAHGIPAALQAAEVPSFAFPESAAIALAHAVKWSRWREIGPGDVPALVRFDADKARAVVRGALARPAVDGARWLRPDECEAVLAAVGVATPGWAKVTSAAEAAAAATRIGYPVALKLVSDTLTHKTDVGGVALGLASADEVEDAWATMARRLADAGHANAMQGALVQAMVPEGVDTLVGVARDPSFGPLVAFGLGGVMVELLGDVLFRVAPLTDRDAAGMVRGIRAAKRFSAWRGRPASDTAAIEDVLLRISQLVAAVPEIAEMDLNPLRVGAKVEGALALDVRIGVREG